VADRLAPSHAQRGRVGEGVFPMGTTAEVDPKPTFALDFCTRKTELDQKVVYAGANLDFRMLPAMSIFARGLWGI
jgi:hypothetical protein